MRRERGRQAVAARATSGRARRWRWRARGAWLAAGRAQRRNARTWAAPSPACRECGWSTKSRRTIGLPSPLNRSDRTPRASQSRGEAELGKRRSLDPAARRRTSARTHAARPGEAARAATRGRQSLDGEAPSRPSPKADGPPEPARNCAQGGVGTQARAASTVEALAVDVGAVGFELADDDGHALRDRREHHRVRHPHEVQEPPRSFVRLAEHHLPHACRQPHAVDGRTAAVADAAGSWGQRCGRGLRRTHPRDRLAHLPRQCHLGRLRELRQLHTAPALGRFALATACAGDDALVWRTEQLRRDRARRRTPRSQSPRSPLAAAAAACTFGILALAEQRPSATSGADNANGARGDTGTHECNGSCHQAGDAEGGAAAEPGCGHRATTRRRSRQRRQRRRSWARWRQRRRRSEAKGKDELRIRGTAPDIVSMRRVRHVAHQQRCPPLPAMCPCRCPHLCREVDACAAARREVAVARPHGAGTRGTSDGVDDDRGVPSRRGRRAPRRLVAEPKIPF